MPRDSDPSGGGGGLPPRPALRAVYDALVDVARGNKVSIIVNGVPLQDVNLFGASLYHDPATGEPWGLDIRLTPLA